VVRRHGTVAVPMWSGLQAQLAYRPLFDSIARHAGPEAVDLLNTYLRLGDLAQVRAQLHAAGRQVTRVSVHLTVRHLPSIDAAIAIEVKGPRSVSASAKVSTTASWPIPAPPSLDTATRPARSIGPSKVASPGGRPERSRHLPGRELRQPLPSALRPRR